MGRHYAPVPDTFTGKIDPEHARHADLASRRAAWLTLTSTEREDKLAAMRTLAVADRGAALKAYRAATGGDLAEACAAIPLPEQRP